MHSWLIHFLNRAFVTWLHNEEKTTDKTIIICPSYSLLPEAKALLKEHKTSVPIFLGSQSVSPFEEGAHTGEETARTLSDLVKYTLIGHSERRADFGETDEIIAQKVAMAHTYNIEPILCVQGIKTPVPEGVRIVAYEPSFAIGTGNAETPEEVNEVAAFFKEEKNILYVLYGGSVTEANVGKFTKMEYINGILVGGASLDPQAFSEIVKNA